MSHQATSWVLERSEQEGREFIVLFVIANHCHPDGSGAYPSIKTIASQARMSERGTRYAIQTLEESGELLVNRTKGATANQEWHSRNNYSIPGIVRDGFYRERQPKPEAPVASGNEMPAANPAAKNAIPSGKPSGNHTVPLNKELELKQQEGTDAPQTGTALPLAQVFGTAQPKPEKRQSKNKTWPSRQRFQKERPYVQEVATRSKGEGRAEASRRAIEVSCRPGGVAEKALRAAQEGGY